MQQRTHNLKTWPPFFKETWEGRKLFEYRQNDRDFAVGDILHLEEYDPACVNYTGRTIVAEVTYILQGRWGLPEGWCIMSIEVLDRWPHKN